MAKIITYNVTTTKMNGSKSNTSQFLTFQKAYDFYCLQVDKLNLTNAEYSDSVEINHTAGGIGYDHRVELTIEETEFSSNLI